MLGVSVIIPTFNEEESVKPLVARFANAFTNRQIPYELIVIDDHSTDQTQKIVTELSRQFPVRLFKKQGRRGKAFSLLEGFKHARFDTLAMIDADLQYPPEAIPEMAKMLEHGFDVIVAKRNEKLISFKRKFVSRAFHFLFARALHGLNFDVQSGLKVFRREIAQRVQINPSQWTFDMEFLIKAMHAGYRVGSFPIDFKNRNAGKSKVNLIRTSAEIGFNAVKLKIKRPETIPFLPEMEKEKGNGFHYKGQEFVHHNRLKENETAFHRLSVVQTIILLIIVDIVGIGFYLNWHETLFTLVVVITILYFADLLFNFYLIVRSFSKPPEIAISQEELTTLDEANLPTYTIFCPLYHEWKVLPQFVSAMNRLDYPKDKLQIMLLLEEDDEETLLAVKKMALPSQFEIRVVPDSLPKTKPKACNYGLKFARGDYAVIYDAEDIPDPLQLKKAIFAFTRAEKNVICIQAKLNFYNPHQNILTRIFTAEYSLWFDLVLTGLQSIAAPIPLGGTSNHFRTKDLFRLKGWDSFNVTEDCDLGMRLVKHKYRTAIIDSITHEEANSNLWNWFSQRTRWIKGYVQTYFVHMRSPREFLNAFGDPTLITFQLIVGGKVLSILINPLMWAVTISYFVFRAALGPTIESFYPAPVLYMGVFSLVIGNFLYLYYYMIGCAKREHYDIIKYVFLVPFYWLFMSLAAYRAIFMMFKNPHYWGKTRHGLFLKNKKAVQQTVDLLEIT